MNLIDLTAQEVHNIYCNTGKRVPGEGTRSYGTGSFSDSRTGFTLVVRVTSYSGDRQLKEEWLDPRTKGFKIDMDRL